VKQLLRVGALIIFSSAFVHAQTIADIARKERARQQSTTQKTIVVTTGDIKPGPPLPQTDSTPGEPAPPPTVTADPATADALPGGHNEKWWREQFQKTREDIQRLETRIPVLETNLNTANFEFLTRSYDPDGRGKRAIDDAKLAVESARSDLAKARELFAQLEEDLRRAGGPAGWAR
jgi:hypothetical protein